MSGHTERSISCDALGPLGCDEYLGTTWHGSYAAVRAAAASEQGWTYRNGKDYCPKHSQPAEVSR